MAYQIHICPACRALLHRGTSNASGTRYWFCHNPECEEALRTDGGLVIDVVPQVSLDPPARLLDGLWYVPVQDLHEALDTLEALYAEALRAEGLRKSGTPVPIPEGVLAASGSLLERSGRIT